MRQTFGSMEFFRSVICHGQKQTGRSSEDSAQKAEARIPPWVSEGRRGVHNMEQSGSLTSQQASGKGEEEQDLWASTAF